MLADDEPTADGEAEARDLLAKLGIAPQACLEGAYLDLLTGGRGGVEVE